MHIIDCYVFKNCSFSIFHDQDYSQSDFFILLRSSQFINCILLSRNSKNVLAVNVSQQYSPKLNKFTRKWIITYHHLYAFLERNVPRAFHLHYAVSDFQSPRKLIQYHRIVRFLRKAKFLGTSEASLQHDNSRGRVFFGFKVVRRAHVSREWTCSRCSSLVDEQSSASSLTFPLSLERYGYSVLLDHC